MDPQETIKKTTAGYDQPVPVGQPQTPYIPASHVPPAYEGNPQLYRGNTYLDPSSNQQHLQHQYPPQQQHQQHQQQQPTPQAYIDPERVGYDQPLDVGHHQAPVSGVWPSIRDQNVPMVIPVAPPITVIEGTSNPPSRALLPVAIICCFFSLFCGIIAIIYAVRAKSQYKSGNLIDSKQSARISAIVSTVGFVIGTIVIILLIVIAVA